MRLFENSPAAGQAVIFASTLGAGVVKIVDDGAELTTTKINTGLPLLRIRDVDATDVNTLLPRWKAGASTSPSMAARTGPRPTALEERPSAACRAKHERTHRIRESGFSPGAGETAASIARWTGVPRGRGSGTATIPDDASVNSISFSGTGRARSSSPRPLAMVFSAVPTTARRGRRSTRHPAPAGANRLSTFNVTFLANNLSMLGYVEGQGIFRTTNGGASWTASGTASRRIRTRWVAFLHEIQYDLLHRLGQGACLQDDRRGPQLVRVGQLRHGERRTRLCAG